MATEAVLTRATPAQPALSRVIIAATIGNVLEWFDFLVWLFRRDDRRGVLSDPRPGRVAACHLWRLRPLLPRAAVGRASRRRLYRPPRPPGRPHLVDRDDDDRHDVDGRDPRLCDDRFGGAGHHHAGAA